MKCRVDITVCSDIPAWVNRDVFKRNVDLTDLESRESKIVHNWYHPSWFRDDNNGVRYFTPPAFCFRDGRLYGVNGRHRAELLCRHMEKIPMLLVAIREWPEQKLREIMMRRIEEGEFIEIPDLRINASVTKR